MSDFIVHKLARPAVNDVIYVHNLSIDALKQFILDKRRFSTDDDPKEAAAVYKAIGEPKLVEQRFACLTAFVADTFGGRIIQALYGEGSNLGLILNRAAISSRVLVFNGDVARLGRELLNKRMAAGDVRSLRGNDGDLATQLVALSRNNGFPPVEPRLRGNAFEARLFDGIVPGEVSQVWVQNPLDHEAMAVAVELQLQCGK